MITVIRAINVVPNGATRRAIITPSSSTLSVFFRKTKPPSLLLFHHGRNVGSKIGRMLDMGGMPSAANDKTLIRTVDASKNSKLRAVAFDFHALTQNLDQEQGNSNNNNMANTTTTISSTMDTFQQKIQQKPIQPDLQQVQNVANLLNVKLGGENTDKSSNKSTKLDASLKKDNNSNPLLRDNIRAKYAKKLKGGLAGLELAKQEVANTLQKGGDAAAFEVAASNAASSSTGTRWMAMSGTGQLLSYLTHRSIKIALLPIPLNAKISNSTTNNDPNNNNKNQAKEMQDFIKQLPNVIVELVMDDSGISAPTVTDELLQKLLLEPQRILLVSDKDEYLKAARDLGFMTCRVVPKSSKNQRRGSITTHYTVNSIPQVQDVVNEINGISFNAVLNR